MDDSNDRVTAQRVVLATVENLAGQVEALGKTLIPLVAALKRGGFLVRQRRCCRVEGEGRDRIMLRPPTSIARRFRIACSVSCRADAAPRQRLRSKALLLAWMAVAGHAEGLVFRRLSWRDALTPAAMSDRAIARLVQHDAAAAGYDPALFGGHSLRAGFLTEGAAQGATIFRLQDVSRHKSMQVLLDYVRNAVLFRDHAGQRFS